MTGMAIGYALGGAIDPPVPDMEDPTGEKKLRLNRFDHQKCLPVSYGTVLTAPDCVFVGEAHQVHTENGGGKGSAGSVDVTYYAEAFMALCEGPIQSVDVLWKGPKDKTSREGAAWAKRLGTSTATTPTIVEDADVPYGHGWRYTAGIEWTGNIGLSPVLPVLAAQYTALDTKKTWSGSPTVAISSTPDSVSWDNVNRRWNLGRSDGVDHVDRLGAALVSTEAPSSITTVRSWAVSGLENLVLFLDDYDAVTPEQRYAIVPLGDDGTHVDVVEGTLAGAIFAETLIGVTMDHKRQHWIGLFEDATNSQVTLVRVSIEDGTVETWILPSKTPTNFDPEAVFFDQEFDEFHVVGLYAGNTDRVFVTGRWGATTLTEVEVDTTALPGVVSTLGRHGDYLTGVYDGNKLFRIVLDDVTSISLQTLGTGDPTAASGQITSRAASCYVQEGSARTRTSTSTCIATRRRAPTAPSGSSTGTTTTRRRSTSRAGR
jgi:hypothetical protein